MAPESVVGIGLVLPDLLGTYGDGGNAEVLFRRLDWRGIPARVVPITVDQPLPRQLDVYVLGGGEDAAQSLAVRYAAGLGSVQPSAMIFAVCAGLQLLGREFTVTGGRFSPGLGLIDVRTAAAPERAVGEIIGEPCVPGLDQPLTGFENHQGHTELGPRAQPLGRVLAGIGNGNGFDGVVQDRVIGTYLHGPALARNPQLADMLLERAMGRRLPPLELPSVAALREQRLAAGARNRPGRRPDHMPYPHNTAQGAVPTAQR
jgi:CobQ-like glutamine amidotransferase family enzyme